MNLPVLTEVQILELVAKEYNVTVKEIQGSNRKRPLPESRRMACFFMDDIGHERKDIADALQLDRSNITGQLRVLNDELTLYRDTKEHFQNLLKAVNNLLNKVNNERKTELK